MKKSTNLELRLYISFKKIEKGKTIKHNYPIVGHQKHAYKLVIFRRTQEKKGKILGQVSNNFQSDQLDFWNFCQCFLLPCPPKLMMKAKFISDAKNVLSPKKRKKKKWVNKNLKGTIMKG